MLVYVCIYVYVQLGTDKAKMCECFFFHLWFSVSSDPNNSGPYAIDGALYFKNAESVHSGSYQCVAENVLGLVSQATIVNIVQQGQFNPLLIYLYTKNW